MNSVIPFPQPGKLTNNYSLQDQQPVDYANGETSLYKVIVNKDKCIGAASCVAMALKAFKLNDQQIVTILPTINEESTDNLLTAAHSCPVLAIEIIDKVTGVKLWPRE